MGLIPTLLHNMYYMCVCMYTIIMIPPTVHCSSQLTVRNVIGKPLQLWDSLGLPRLPQFFAPWQGIFHSIDVQQDGLITEDFFQARFNVVVAVDVFITV